MIRFLAVDACSPSMWRLTLFKKEYITLPVSERKDKTSKIITRCWLRFVRSALPGKRRYDKWVDAKEGKTKNRYTSQRFSSRWLRLIGWKGGYSERNQSGHGKGAGNGAAAAAVRGVKRLLRTDTKKQDARLGDRVVL